MAARRYTTAILLGLLVMLALGYSIPAYAQATATFTPSYTATLNNTGLIAIATIPPPRACWSALVPCGPMPFTLPRFPTVSLPSPTRWPTQPTNTPILSTATPTFTHTPTETPTPSHTPTGTLTPDTPTPSMTIDQIFDAGPIQTLSGGVDMMGSTLKAQTTQSVTINGTVVGVNELAETFGEQVGGPFALLRGVQESLGGLGIVGTLINLLFLVVFWTVFVRISVLILRFIVPVIRFVLQFFQTIKPV